MLISLHRIRSGGAPSAATERLARVLDWAGCLYRNPEQQSGPAALARIVARAALDIPPDDPPLRSVAVLGPTQAGKSTVVNLVLGDELAGVSPLAGFTTRPKGFVIADKSAGPVARADADLPTEPEIVEVGRSEGWPSDGPTLVWDTPDFDTLAAGTYRESLLSVVAVSGAFVVVLSAEKYADRSVWHMLRVLALLKRPIVFLLNKLPPRDAEAVLRHFREQVRQQIPELAPSDEEMLLWLPRTSAAPADDPQVRPTVEELRQRLAEIPPVEPVRLRRDAARLVRAFWHEWTAPIRAENEAKKRYRSWIDRAGRDFVQRYRESLLNDPRRREVVGETHERLKKDLGPSWYKSLKKGTGRVVGWFKKMPHNGSGRSDGRREAARHSVTVSHQVVLDELVDGILYELDQFCKRQWDQPHEDAPFWQALTKRLKQRGAPPPGPVAAGPFWQALAERLKEREPQLRRELGARIRELDEAFQRDLQVLIKEVEASIRKRKGVMKWGRRMSYPVAGMAVTAAVLSVANPALLPVALAGGKALWGLGGIAAPILDAILCDPGLRLLLERRAWWVRRRQNKRVRRDFVDAVLRPSLAALVQELEGPGISNISKEDLAKARYELRRLGSTP